MKMRISLFRHLEKIIEVLGGPAPELVLKDFTPGKMKFVLSVDVTKFPRCPVSVLPKEPHIFSGDDPHNSSVAEHKALMSVKNFLEENFSLQIHDFSYPKLKTFELKITDVVSSINAFTNRFRSFIGEFQSCINLLAPIISSSSVDSSPFINGVSKSLSELCKETHDAIARIEDHLITLNREMTIYCSSASNSTLSTSLKVFCQQLHSLFFLLSLASFIC